MANHKSALKRYRQSQVRNKRNNMVRTRVKNVVKDVRAAIEANDTELAATALRKATSVLDSAASKKVIHSRAAARRISRLHAAVNKMA
ncbi:30S ribosomal protein S20 [Maridesulfovibrio sp.]|uniref:30S ribosomal protein S20 n=1 Tax=Maridesulfovibrio sp. TaxID=2795000 RepID=UPI002A18DDFF|nr:30S ribosomal protein S20 [Maridesulfovibrio sp.]